MKLATKRKLSLWLFAVGIASVGFSTWHYRLDRYASDIYSESFGNKIERSLKKVAGENARSCGTLLVPRDSPLVNRCSDALDQEEGPFFSVYAITTADGLWYRGIARAPDGTYKEFHWKPAPDEVQFVFAGPDPVQAACEDPHTLRKTWQNVPTCTSDH